VLDLDLVLFDLGRRWDHYAPHVHTVFAEYEARIVIETLEPLAESFGEVGELVLDNPISTTVLIAPLRDLLCHGGGRECRGWDRGARNRVTSTRSIAIAPVQFSRRVRDRCLTGATCKGGVAKVLARESDMV
jgi:hypothetical protein